MKRMNKISHRFVFWGSLLILIAGVGTIFAAKDPGKSDSKQVQSKGDPASQKPVLLEKKDVPLPVNTSEKSTAKVEPGSSVQSATKKDGTNETVKSFGSSPAPKMGSGKSNKTKKSKEPVLNSPQKAIEWAVSDWRKISQTVDRFREGRRSNPEVPYRVSRYQGSGSSASLSSGSVQIDKKERDQFITQEPRILQQGVGNDPSTSPIRNGQNFISAPQPQADPQKPIYGDFTPDKVQLSQNDILVQDSIVEIPKGEGYEALISANGQGLLVELGAEVLDKDGKAVLDKDGKPKRIPFKRGMRVSKGQILGKQNDREHAANRLVAEQQLIVAKKEAEKQLEIEVARFAVLVAQSEYLRVEQANKQMSGAVPAEEVVKKAYEWKRADKAAEKAVYDLGVKADEVEVRKAQVIAADAQVTDRKLVSPLDGFIDDIMQDEGQWLREGDNILKIIRLDKVQVCGKIDANVYSPEMVDGKNVTVYVKKPGSSVKKVDGKITYARQIVESGKFYIYAEVKNICNEKGYWLLNPGTIVTMVVHR